MSRSQQAELERIYKRMSREHEKLTDAEVAFAIREIGRVRGDVADLLADFADSDSVIKRQRLSRLLRELDAVERSIRTEGTAVLTDAVRKSAEYTTEGVNGAMIAAVGAPMVSANVERLNREIVNYVVRRFGDDGLVLSDRVWGTAGDIRDAIGASLRSDILRGETVATMAKNVRQVYENETWKIKRLVHTERMTAYRAASAMSVQRSDIVEWVELIDNGARHRNHSAHACYKLARENRYGRGAGVFKPTDTDIWTPHPGCSSYIVAVLDPQYL